MLRVLLLLLGLFALAACEKREAAVETDEASPLFYEITDGSGATRGWLFGTIHALPDGVDWQTEALNQAVEQADVLLVEIATLENSAALAHSFARLATSPDQPDIGTRVSVQARPALFDLISRSNYSASDFEDVETWAAALMLAQVSSTGKSENGADRVLLRRFEGREIAEFEGAEVQLGIFDLLPEEEQSDLLEGVVAEHAKRSEDPGRLQRAWLKGDLPVLKAATREGIMADPELRAALLTDRNDAWIDQLDNVLESGKRPLVAVGAAHLVGPDGLPALLTERGYTVERIQ